jgi:PTS system nitrogen regulatory IIA component
MVLLMIDLSDILGVDSVASSMSVANKKSLITQLGFRAARRTGLDHKVISAALHDRERLGSTGFGGGIAIPHGKLLGLGRVYGYFARLAQPIEFHAVDGLPVDLVFLLLSPLDAGADHLKALAGVSRMLRDRDMVAKLRGARSKDAMFALLAGGETLHAA